MNDTPTNETQIAPAPIVTQVDRDLRNALIDHWEDLPEAGIDELLAQHRIAGNAIQAGRGDE
jgi:hypothetical protein